MKNLQLVSLGPSYPVRASDALAPSSTGACEVAESRVNIYAPVHLLFMVSCPLPSHCMLTCSGRLELWTLRQMVLLGLCYLL